MAYDSNNLPPPNGPRFTPPPGARPDPDRPRGKWRLAKNIEVGDNVFIEHRLDDLVFSTSREVVAFEKDAATGRVSLVFKPKIVHRGQPAPDRLDGIDPEQRFLLWLP